MDMKNLIKKILRESDDLDWIREIPNIYDLIRPGTVFYCEVCKIQTFIALLKLIEQKYPEAEWRSGHKPTEYIPGSIAYLQVRVLGINSNGTLWWAPSLNEVEDEIIDISPYESFLLSI